MSLILALLVNHSVLWAATLPARSPCVLQLSNAPKVSAATGKETASAMDWLRRQTPNGQTVPLTLTGRTEFRRFLEVNGQDYDDLKSSTSDLNHWAGRYIITLWQRWDSVADAQRDAALAAELTALTPWKQATAPLAFSARNKLEAQSHVNLKRLLAQLESLIPLHTPPTPLLSQQLDEATRELELHFIGQRQTTLRPGVALPLVSPRELQKLGLDYPQTSYAQLLGHTESSVAFRTVGVRKHQNKPIHLSHMYDEGAELDHGFARRHGFLMPNLISSKSFYRFFEHWDTLALEEMVHSNRFFLPSTVLDYRGLKMFELANAGKPLILPVHYYRALARLRMRLHEYILTVDDATEFFREALKRHMLHHAELGNNGNFSLIMTSWNNDTGAQRFFADELLHTLGWDDGAVLRVPISVPGSQLTYLP